jgi:hypothetical protein
MNSIHDAQAGFHIAGKAQRRRLNEHLLIEPLLPKPLQSPLSPSSWLNFLARAQQAQGFGKAKID